MGKVLHASGSGYFPSCIVAGDPEECPWTLENAMKMYWRVRTWRFQANGILYDRDSDTEYEFSADVQGITSVDVDEIPQTLEEGLVCSNYFLGSGTDIFFGLPEKSGNLYNSGLLGYVETGADTGDIVGFEFSTKTVGTFSASILGVNIPMFGYIGNDEPNYASMIEASATLTPSLWWSYGGTYDTATGSPL
jgi:hypothetical protein